jgi:hypothetical protein
MNWIKRSMVLLVLFALLVPALSSGCGTGPSSANASGGGAQAKVTDGIIVIDHVGFVPSGGMWRVAAHIKNTSNQYSCTGATYSATIFDENSVVLGNDTALFPNIYPGEDKWFASGSLLSGPTSPDRADFRLSGMDWRKIPVDDVPVFTMVQSNYIATAGSDSKVTGIVRYAGKATNARIGLTSVLVSAGNDPVEASSTVLENMPAGDYPFEMPYLRYGATAPTFRTLVVSAFILPR